MNYKLIMINSTCCLTCSLLCLQVCVLLMMQNILKKKHLFICHKLEWLNYYRWKATMSLFSPFCLTQGSQTTGVKQPSVCVLKSDELFSAMSPVLFMLPVSRNPPPALSHLLLSFSSLTHTASVCEDNIHSILYKQRDYCPFCSCLTSNFTDNETANKR